MALERRWQQVEVEFESLSSLLVCFDVMDPILCDNDLRGLMQIFHSAAEVPRLTAVDIQFLASASPSIQHLYAIQSLKIIPRSCVCNS